jgi:hypothetical protein
MTKPLVVAFSVQKSAHQEPRKQPLKLRYPWEAYHPFVIYGTYDSHLFMSHWTFANEIKRPPWLLAQGFVSLF